MKKNIEKKSIKRKPREKRCGALLKGGGRGVVEEGQRDGCDAVNQPREIAKPPVPDLYEGRTGDRGLSAHCVKPRGSDTRTQNIPRRKAQISHPVRHASHPYECRFVALSCCEI